MSAVLQAEPNKLGAVDRPHVAGNRRPLLQRKCACGGSPGLDGECVECKRGRLALLRQRANHGRLPAVPSIVHEVLHSPGQPLRPATRTLMEARLGQDFSRVRVHADAKAGASAAAVNALAYAVGSQIVFSHGRYRPETAPGCTLLAHELAHVAQQEGQQPPGHIVVSDLETTEREAEDAERLVVSDGLPGPDGPSGWRTSIARSPGPPALSRKLALHSDVEAKAFAWFLTAADAKLFSFSRAKRPYEVSMSTPTPKAVEDPFRVAILKAIIDHSETLFVRKFDLDTKVTAHELYKDGKLDKKGVAPTLREMSWPLGAGGVTIPSVGLALAAESDYGGPVTGIAGQSWIFFSSPGSLAHEFGHAYLVFSGAPWPHGREIPETAGITTPPGKAEAAKPFKGDVDVFISEFVAEKFAELELFDPGALHFSPTAIRKWPEPPDYKSTFEGTWLEFKAKYPGASVKQKMKGKKRVLEVCIPKPGETCL